MNDAQPIRSTRLDTNMGMDYVLLCPVGFFANAALHLARYYCDTDMSGSRFIVGDAGSPDQAQASLVKRNRKA